jgi:hypothetical protein
MDNSVEYAVQNENEVSVVNEYTVGKIEMKVKRVRPVIESIPEITE